MDHHERIPTENLERWIHYEDDKDTAAQVLPRFAAELKDCYRSIDLYKREKDVICRISTRAVVRERARQISESGYDADHDAEYKEGELAKAAHAVLDVATNNVANFNNAAWRAVFDYWEFAEKRCYIDQLVVAAALILAELDNYSERQRRM